MPEPTEKLKRIRAQINRANKLIGSLDNMKIAKGRVILQHEVAMLDQLIEKITAAEYPESPDLNLPKWELWRG